MPIDPAIIAEIVKSSRATRLFICLVMNDPVGTAEQLMNCGLRFFDCHAKLVKIASLITKNIAEAFCFLVVRCNQS